MKPLFSREGRSELARFLQRHPKPLFLFDFDGTLAPIVARADDARMSSSMRKALLALAGAASVGILTGRSLRDLSSRMPNEVRLRIGNHGMEARGIPGAASWRRDAARARKLTRTWKTSLKRALAEQAHPPGLDIEDKRLSLTLHYRNSEWSDRRFLAFVKKWIRSLPRTERPKLVLGKKVANFLPSFGKDKGQAALDCLRLLKKRGLFFVGDDVTDESVFALGGRDRFTVRVGRITHSRAGYYVRSLSELERLLRHLTV